jgi:hypothetical protein
VTGVEVQEVLRCNHDSINKHCMFREIYRFCLSPTSFYLTVVRSRGIIEFDHTQGRTTVGRTPLDEGSARRRVLYLTTHNTHNRQTSMPLAGFEPAIPAGDPPQTLALERSATGIGIYRDCCVKICI